MHTALNNWILVTQRAAAIKMVWYATFRRLILDKLLKIDMYKWADDDLENNLVLKTFMEFSIQDYRSWLFDDFDDVKKREGKYLRLDPTAPENEEAFHMHSLIINPHTLTSLTVQDYVADFLRMPPKDDNWLGGQVPLPEPETTFKANLLRYAPSGGVEALPLAGGEGYANIPKGTLIWEGQDPELPFCLQHFIVYLRAHGALGISLVLSYG